MVSYKENVCKKNSVMQYALQYYMKITAKKTKTRIMCTTFTYKASVSKLSELKSCYLMSNFEC